MKVEGLKEAWIEALESDEFEQGTGALRVDGKYCCLGVLCEVARTKFGLNIDVVPQIENFNEYVDYDKYVSPYGDSFVYNGDEVSGDWEILPVGLAEWAGIEVNPEVYSPEDERKVRLSDLNDGGSSFREIAKLIKESDL